VISGVIRASCFSSPSIFKYAWMVISCSLRCENIVYLVGASEEEFLTTGFCNWKNATGSEGKLEKHVKSTACRTQLQNPVHSIQV